MADINSIINSAYRTHPDIFQREITTYNSFAELLSDIFQEYIMYVHIAKTVMIWENDSKLWKVVKKDEMYKLFEKKVLLNILKLTVNSTDATRFVSRLHHMFKKRVIDSMLSCLEKDPKFIDKNFDKNPDLFAVADGMVVDLRSGECRERQLSDYITCYSDIKYDPANTNRFGERLLHRMFGRIDSDLVGNDCNTASDSDLDIPNDFFHYIHKWLGYSLTGHTNWPNRVFCLNSSINSSVGWSTFSQLMRTVLAKYSDVLQPRELFRRINISSTARTVFVTRHDDITLNNIKELQDIGEDLNIKFYVRSYNIIDRYKSGSIGRIINAPSIFVNEGCIHSEHDAKTNIYVADTDVYDKLKDPEILTGLLNFLVKGAIYWYEEGLDNNPPRSYIESNVKSVGDR